MAAGRDLPHDLVQFTIERALDIRDGFWGLLAHGASFASVGDLIAAEALVGLLWGVVGYSTIRVLEWQSRIHATLERA